MHKIVFSTFLISICLTSTLQAKPDNIIRELEKEKNPHHPSKKMTFDPTYIQMERSRGKCISSAASFSDDENLPLNQQVFLAILTNRSMDKAYYANYKGKRLTHYFSDGVKVEVGTFHRGLRAYSLRKLDKSFVKLNPEYRKIKISKKPNKENLRGSSKSTPRQQEALQNPNNDQFIRRIKRVLLQDGNYRLEPRYLEIIRYGNTYITSFSKSDYYCRYYSEKNGKKLRDVKRATIYRTKNPLISLEDLDKRYCKEHSEMSPVKASKIVKGRQKTKHHK